ncbi:MAG: sulfatase [Verrucomicrobiota bacterium]
MKTLCSLAIQTLIGFSYCFAEKPNVLLIAVDDLNDWAGYRGHEQVISPNMDRLARESVWFSRAYCQYPVCGPSRASLMSGFYFHQLESDTLGISDRDVAKKAESMGSQLLHSYFGKHGYKTMAVGKILHRHLPDEGLDLSGGRGGWGTLEDRKGNRLKLQWQSQKTMTDWGITHERENKMSDSEAADWARDRLAEEHEEPFFLMVGFLRPHVPWYVPERYYEMYDPEAIELPPFLRSDLDDVPDAGKETLNDGYPRTEWARENDQWRNMIHAYLASITFVDRKIGQVLDALEASPHADNTVVVLWSDHGYHLGEKNTFQKHTLWDRSAKAPLIIKSPANGKGEYDLGRCDRVVGLIDLYPTLVDLCGLPANDKVVGRSLKPLLKDRKTKWNYPALTYRKEGGKSIQYADYRYIEYGDGSMELYDHGEDPNEWTNLAGNPEYAEVLGEMKEKFQEAHLEAGEWRQRN